MFPLFEKMCWNILAGFKANFPLIFLKNIDSEKIERNFGKDFYPGILINQKVFFY